MKHLHKWIKALVDGLETHADGQTVASVLENCGRACVPRGFVEKVKACKNSSKSMDEFLDKLNQNWSHLQRDGDNIYVVYKECYCPLVKTYPGQLLPAFCNCSRGWIKELFETALERPVEVELVQSIRRGDQVCKFTVKFQDSG